MTEGGEAEGKRKAEENVYVTHMNASSHGRATSRPVSSGIAVGT
jgi:hypothetical protein